MATARFRYNYPQDDYLEVVAEDGAFRGRGIVEAAFTEPWGSEAAAGIIQFVFDAGFYPLGQASFSLEQPGTISLRVRQVNSVGHLQAELRLGEFFHESSEAIFRFRIDYEELKRLSSRLKDMIEAGSCDFTLNGQANQWPSV